ncbi:TSUP family transporter [Chroococcidiopsis sp. FACHB-1243]|nr:TSUP family transporter [Chroococcidiopsis sp. [FACHB-1243]]
MEISNFTLAGLAATSFVAGIIDTIPGGGGMLTLPTLLSTGLSPANALATNKLQSFFGTASSSLHFLRQDRVNARKSWLVIACAFVGAALGATVVQLINPSFLSRVVLFCNAPPSKRVTCPQLL